MVRLKNRYILFEILENGHNVEQRELLDKILQSLQYNFGTVASGLLNSSLYIKYYSQKTGKGILQADRTYFRLAWAALTFIDLDGKGFIRAMGISGTMRKAEERLIRNDQLELFIS